jgi:DNA-binding MarR family transcriptional regulator
MGRAMPKLRVSNLEDHLGYWLRYVSNQVSHAFGRKVEARGVTVAEWVMLRVLYEHDTLAPSVLAERLGMTRGAISKLADRLVGKALLTQTAGKEDRRYQTLALTPVGRTLVPQLSALADENDAEFFGGLAPADRAAIMRIMRDLVGRHGLRAPPVD